LSVLELMTRYRSSSRKGNRLALRRSKSIPACGNLIELKFANQDHALPNNSRKAQEFLELWVSTITSIVQFRTNWFWRLKCAVRQGGCAVVIC
jgi:hypothetical protein